MNFGIAGLPELDVKRRTPTCYSRVVGELQFGLEVKCCPCAHELNYKSVERSVMEDKKKRREKIKSLHQHLRTNHLLARMDATRS